MKKIFIILSISMLCFACGGDMMQHSASGVLEATEIIVSAMATGQVEQLNIVEGQQLVKGDKVGFIDTTQLFLQKRQLQTGVRFINTSKPDIAQQIAVVQEQIDKAMTEKTRVQNLLKDGAATEKQLDDVDAQLKVLQRTLAAQKNQLSTGISSLTGESSVREIQIAQVDDLLRKSYIVSPIDGVVIEKYIEQSEVVAPGVPIFKIADTKNLFLRAYIVADQLDKIKIGSTATVYSNNADGAQRTYKGRVTWISDKAEFTPKTIQTQSERQNLVYAVKITVENTDGLLKIGMYGDVDFGK
ncbi:MAG: HlyD family efflux transporter periplasmic adaptor subunit [Prevotellaceae bacterium]|jgi:HlyD family secretion protein|nr:HlyD family efflux transporter periplasmic adaptor subunit [Prevotellaceae bacterium]